MSKSHTERKMIVRAVRTAVNHIDKFSSTAVTPEDIEEYYAWFDDSKIGGESRRMLAAFLRRKRKNLRFRDQMAEEIMAWRQHFKMNLLDFKAATLPPRLYPTRVVVPPRPAKRHRDCMYCGTGWAGEVVCGACKEQGIDGKVIRGTSATKGSSYTQWNKRP